MNFKLIIFSATISISILFGQKLDADKINRKFWKNNSDNSIVWNVKSETVLPHEDNIEMDGLLVASIITYKIDQNKEISVNREIIFPQLRVFIKTTDSKWGYYRAYLKDNYKDNILPKIFINDKIFIPGAVDSIRIQGKLIVYHKEKQGIRIQRIFTPSVDKRLFVEKWIVTNCSDSTKHIRTGLVKYDQEEPGVLGRYRREVFSDAADNKVLNAGETFEFGVYIAAYLNDEQRFNTTADEEILKRSTFLQEMKSNLVLETPDADINKLFYYSKIRAAESIYQTSMGLMHSPGGGRYYTGVWANDQCEYSSPFFPYLGYKTGNQAAYNSYKMYLNNLPADGGKFWSSYEMDGTVTCCGMDRGDAAMIAFGASHFCLVNGDKEKARELWPLIEWSLNYCNNQRNDEGVINSESDEMEGRIATGGANLATSSLYYGALKQSIYLASALNLPGNQIDSYKNNLASLEKAIENYFGAEINGLKSYKYFKGHNYLRHWICLPLVVGINERKDGTLTALFDKLWNENGVRVEYNPDLPEPDLFWDRGTLYAFRGAFKSGAADKALQKLKSFTQTRLLGFHVPYVVEAWPEGNMAHLSAESALYCRIFTEGILGLEATSFNSFSLKPQLPEEWEYYNLKNIKAFNTSFDIHITRINNKINIRVINKGNTVLDKNISMGEQVRVKL